MFINVTPPGGALWAILGNHLMPTSCLKIAPSYPPSLPPHAYIKERQQQPPSTPKKTSTLFLPVTYKGDDISASKRAIELILGSNWGRIQFPIHWCTLQGRTLPVERSPLSALVTKLAFSVSIGWQPIVRGGPVPQFPTRPQCSFNGSSGYIRA